MESEAFLFGLACDGGASPQSTQSQYLERRQDRYMCDSRNASGVCTYLPGRTGFACPVPLSDMGNLHARLASSGQSGDGSVAVNFGAQEHPVIVTAGTGLEAWNGLTPRGLEFYQRLGYEDPI